jgi:hypothetical protein
MDRVVTRPSGLEAVYNCKEQVKNDRNKAVVNAS